MGRLAALGWQAFFSYCCFLDGVPFSLVHLFVKIIVLAELKPVIICNLEHVRTIAVMRS